jgi:hypothetical protein
MRRLFISRIILAIVPQGASSAGLLSFEFNIPAHHLAELHPDGIGAPHSLHQCSWLSFSLLAERLFNFGNAGQGQGRSPVEGKTGLLLHPARRVMGSFTGQVLDLK